MNNLQEKILNRIRQEGPLTFESFMDMALYDPEYGYYTSGKSRIGREGDFYTSSHLHPVFGAMIGRQICSMWEFMGRPRDFGIVEMGAGEGYLCMDMLDYFLQSSGGTIHREFLDCVTYHIIEKGPFFRQRQQERLSGYRGKVVWHEEIAGSGPFVGCLLSNELLDAFPVHLVQMEDVLKEIYVTARGGDLAEEPGPLSSDAISAYFSDHGVQLPKGYRTEVNLRMKEWLRDISGILNEGFLFTIDYGYPAWDYYSEDRNRGTLLCYYGHQVIENPYRNIGGQDMTAHVNFSALKRWGEEAAFRTVGFCQQGIFLVSLGIDEEIQRLAAVSKDYLFEVARIKKLILPGTLGETHKVMIQYKGEGEPELRGFSMKNQERTL